MENKRLQKEKVFRTNKHTTHTVSGAVSWFRVHFCRTTGGLWVVVEKFLCVVVCSAAKHRRIHATNMRRRGNITIALAGLRHRLWQPRTRIYLAKWSLAPRRSSAQSSETDYINITFRTPHIWLCTSIYPLKSLSSRNPIYNHTNPKEWFYIGLVAVCVCVCVAHGPQGTIVIEIEYLFQSLRLFSASTRRLLYRKTNFHLAFIFGELMFFLLFEENAGKP